MVDSNLMRYLLSCRLLQGCAARWVVILQEFDLEFVSQKIPKALTLSALMTDLPPLTTSSPPMDDIPDYFLFFICTDDPWYGDILLYLQTQNFLAHFNHEDRRRIRHQAIHYLLVGDVLYRRGIDTILRRCLTHDEAETILNDSHSGACGGHLSGIGTAQKILHVGYF